MMLLERVVGLSENFMETNALRMDEVMETDTLRMGELGEEARAAQVEFLPRLARPLQLDQLDTSTKELPLAEEGKPGRSSLQQLRKSIGNKESVNSTRSHVNASHTTTSTILLSTDWGFSLPRIIGVVLVTLVGLGVACMFMEEEESIISCDRVHEGPAKPREELLAMESCDGTWAITYQNAEGQSKQGLELLFRCHIIPTQEFAHARVAQEHIDECVWIATHMLRQKTLEEWFEEWPSARDAFDDSVRKCYEERKDVRLERQNSAVQPGMADARSEKEITVGEAREWIKESAATAKGGTKAAAPAAKERTGMLKIGDKKSLMDRCRQIMAASDAGRKPRSAADSSTSPAKTASPPQKPAKGSAAAASSAGAAKGSAEKKPDAES